MGRWNRLGLGSCMAGIFVVLLGLDVKHDQMFKLIAVIWGGAHIFCGFLALATKEPM